MLSFIQPTRLLFLSLLFIACNNKKSSQETVIGKWLFKEIEVPAGMPDEHIQEDNADMKGMILQFNPDNTFIFTKPGDKDTIKGSYHLKDSLMEIKNNIDPDLQSAGISFPQKNIMRIEDKRNFITILVEKME